MKILVTGVSGLGGHLAPHLMAAGHDIVGLSRDPRRVSVDVPVVQADAATGAGLDDAMQGVDVVYFLINTYEQSNSEGFAARDRRVAHNIADAARRCGVGRIVYLGVPSTTDSRNTSEHMTSRLEVEDILLEATPNSVGVGVFTIVSPRSRSFRVLLRTLDANPLVPLPPWRNHHIQPIDIRDVFACLVAAGTDPDVGGRRLRIGGPETMTWEALLRLIAQKMGKRRAFLPIPLNYPRPLRHYLAVKNGGNPALALPLMDSMATGDVVVDHNDAETLGISLHSITQTVEHAIAEYSTGSWQRTEGVPMEPTLDQRRRGKA
ncbi:NAD(P)H-binding protein [Nocardia anaemiae]|uniref:NAD(P)H-binding protein n=1 Tax=Nocardia anaemiae TaxID=263910 RepID=UPI0007C708E8|nr:NAD(P)H-binding protein [Nocardia anaemiae]